MGPGELLIIGAIVVALWFLASNRAFRSVDERWTVERADREPRPWWLNPWVLVAVQLGIAAAVLVATRGRFFLLVLFLPLAFALRPRRRGDRPREAPRRPGGNGSV